MRTCRDRSGFKPLLATAAVVAGLVIWGATATAQAGSATPEQQIDQLTKQIDNLQQEVAQLKDQMAVKQPAPAASGAAVAPQSIGQHVGLVEKDLAQTRKDLATNLGVHIHGLVDATYEYNANHPGLTSSERVNQFRAFDTEANGFDLQQFNLHIDRTSDGGIGFVTDINFGRVAQVLHGATNYGGTFGSSEVDPTQAYLTYTIPVGSGINLSVGKFATLIGEEVIKTYNALNYNESDGLLFTLGIPFTHTGIRASYVINPQIALTLGVNNGWDDPQDNNSGKSVEGQIALTPAALPSVSMLINGMYGPEQVNHGNSKLGIIDPILTWKTPIPGVTLINEYIYAHETEPVSASPLLTGPNEGVNPLYYSGGLITRNVDWQAWAGYVVYDYTDRLQFALRGEVFRDSDGARTGIRQTLGEGTIDINYKLSDSLLVRAEYRHDESNASPFYTNRAAPTPLAAGVNPTYTTSGQDTLLGAFIYTF